jgi:oligopeptide transport system ATP-binding protein
VPRLDEERQEELKTIEGVPPDLLNPPSGCPFLPRCLFARHICHTMPPLEILPGSAHHRKACWPDITTSQEQAYAEQRRLARMEVQKAGPGDALKRF